MSIFAAVCSLIDGVGSAGKSISGLNIRAVRERNTVGDILTGVFMKKSSSPPDKADETAPAEWQPPKSEADSRDRALDAITAYIALSHHSNPADPVAAAALDEIKRLHSHSIKEDE